MSTAEQIIADVLGEHGTRAYVAAHVVAALTNAGYALVKDSRVEYLLCGHPGWPDPLDVWPPTEENALRVWDEYVEPDKHPKAILVRRFGPGGREVIRTAAARVAEGGDQP
ncbi:hypothetical protein GS490_13525 [Rhodococcus hoagii]|nr:hypothetical protein [Prescottella equi]